MTDIVCRTTGLQVIFGIGIIPCRHSASDLCYDVYVDMSRTGVLVQLSVDSRPGNLMLITWSDVAIQSGKYQHMSESDH